MSNRLVWWKGGSTRDSLLNDWDGNVNRVLPITSLIVFQVSLGVLEFASSWIL